MRLFRALPKNENILNSDNRAFSDDSNNINSICILNEIYSQIVPTHNLSRTRERRIIYSFTDDIDVACRFVEKYPDAYDKIGYIDVDITEKSSALIENNNNIFLIKPVFRFLDWIDLTTYKVIKNGDYNTSTTIINTNYSRKAIPLINTLVPSRWGALSLAYTAREYAVICRELVPTILSKQEIDIERKNKKLVNYELLLSNIDSTTTKNKVIKSLKNDLEKLNISQVRKKYLFKMLTECESK